MTYRIEFAGPGALQFHQLPTHAQDALIARAVELVEEPWDARVALPGTDPSFRSTEFGEAGLLFFHVRDSDRTISLYEIVWAG